LAIKSKSPRSDPWGSWLLNVRWRRDLLVISKPGDDLIKFLNGNEPPAMHKLVAINCLAEFGNFRSEVVTAVGELSPFGTAGGSQRPLTTLDESRGLLRGRKFHYDVPLCQSRRKAAGAESGTHET
jgi:hypothetical protein